MKMKIRPQVSIIIPVYNGSNYLKEAIDSALAQTYKNVEIIVINDGSNDGGKTDKICKSYGNKIRYCKKENGGAASALNMGIEKMKGEYFSWLSHDDIYYPEKIEKQIRFLDKFDDKNTVLYSNVEYIDENSKTIYKTEYEKKHSIETLSNGVFPVFYGYTNGCSMLIPKKCFEYVGLFNEKLKTANDYDMWFRLFKKCKTAFIPEVLIKYRFHDLQGTKTVAEDKRVAESDRIWSKAIKQLKDREVESFGVNIFNFYLDLSKRMAEAKKLKSQEIASKRAKTCYKKNAPSVSVIMPCYNSEKYLKEAIESILNQTYANFELIIVDDGSTDNTWRIIQEYKKKDFRVVTTKNLYKKGIPGGMNTGLDLSRGRYITRMDSDDISLPTRFEKQVSFLTNNEKYGFCSTNMSAFGKIDSPGLYKKQEAPLEWLFFWSNPVPSAATMYRAKIIKDNGIKFRDYKVAQDYDFLAQVQTVTKGHILYEEPLYQYRIYARSNFQKNFEEALKNSKKINTDFIKGIIGEKPSSVHWDLTEFTIPTHGQKDLDLFEAAKWVELLLEKSKKFWNWEDEEYQDARSDGQKRIIDYFSAKIKNDMKSEIAKRDEEIEMLKKESRKESFRIAKYPAFLKKKYKRFWELIDSQGWETTLKNIVLKFKR